jgi:hypothetical protein
MKLVVKSNNLEVVPTRVSLSSREDILGGITTRFLKNVSAPSDFDHRVDVPVSALGARQEVQIACAG